MRAERGGERRSESKERVKRVSEFWRLLSLSYFRGQIEGPASDAALASGLLGMWGQWSTPVAHRRAAVWLAQRPGARCGGRRLFP